MATAGRRTETLITAGLTRAGVTVNGPNPWDIRVLDNRLFRRVVGTRELGFGDSYVEGWWECDRIDELVTRILRTGIKRILPPGISGLTLAARSVITNTQGSERAGDNATAHYGQHDALLRLILGEPLVYSCADWRDATDLADAQHAKIDRLASKLQLRPGMRVLDIGCGWGATADYLSTRHGVIVVGITPVAAQATHAARHHRHSDVSFVTTDFSNFTSPKPFDRIYSVGMVEHVGPKNLKPFFRHCQDLLVDDGIMFHQTIGRRTPRASTDAWIDRRIFPGGAIPSVQQLSRAWSAGWVLEDFENLGPDYDRTLMAWLGLLEGKKDQVLDQFGEEMYRTFRFYFQYCAGAFRARELQLWQLVLTKHPAPYQYRRPNSDQAARWAPIDDHPDPTNPKTH